MSDYVRSGSLEIRAHLAAEILSGNYVDGVRGTRTVLRSGDICSGQIVVRSSMTICQRCCCGFDGHAGDRSIKLCNRCCLRVATEAGDRLTMPYYCSGQGLPTNAITIPPGPAWAAHAGREADRAWYGPAQYQYIDEKGVPHAVGSCGYGAVMRPEHSGCLPDISLMPRGVCL